MDSFGSSIVKPLTTFKFKSDNEILIINIICLKLSNFATKSLKLNYYSLVIAEKLINGGGERLWILKIF